MLIKREPYQLEFFAYEVVGVEVLAVAPDGITKEIVDKDDMFVGKHIWVPGVCGGYFEAIVTERLCNGASATSVSGNLFCSLHWTGEDKHDFRQCWVCDCQGDMRGLARVNFD